MTAIPMINSPETIAEPSAFRVPPVRDADRIGSGASTLDELYAKAILIRSVEERLLELFSQGKPFGTVHTCIGQEWTGVAVAEHLLENDWVVSNHRCHGHFIARNR